MDLSYLVAIADWFPVDKLLRAVAAKVRYHNLIHAEGSSFYKPLTRLVQVGKDGPHLENSKY